MPKVLWLVKARKASSGIEAGGWGAVLRQSVPPVHPLGLALSKAALGCFQQRLLLLLAGEACTVELWVGAVPGAPGLSLLGWMGGSPPLPPQGCSLTSLLHAWPQFPWYSLAARSLYSSLPVPWPRSHKLVAI